MIFLSLGIQYPKATNHSALDDLSNAILFDEKHTFLEISRYFRTFSKNFLIKLLKMYYFSICLKKVSEPCVTFSRVRTKNTNCLKNLRKS